MSVAPIPEEPASVSADAAPGRKERLRFPKNQRQSKRPRPAKLSTKQRAVAIAVAVAILAVPIGYLALRGSPRGVSADECSACGAGAVHFSIGKGRERQPDGGKPHQLVRRLHQRQSAGARHPLLDSIVAEDGKNAIAWNDLCVAHTMQMEYSVAIEDCNGAIRIAPDFQLARNNLKWAQDEKQKAITGHHRAGTDCARLSQCRFLPGGGARQPSHRELRSGHQSMAARPRTQPQGCTCRQQYRHRVHGKKAARDRHPLVCKGDCF